LPDRRLPIAAIEVTAKAVAAIKHATRIEAAAETGDATTTAEAAAQTVRGRAPVATRRDHQVVQVGGRAGATATTTRRALVAGRVPTGKTRLAHAVDPAPRRIVVAGATAVGAIVTTTRRVGVAVLAPIGKTRRDHAADQVLRLIGAVAAIGVTAGVATTVGATDAVDVATTVGVTAAVDVTATGVTVAVDVATTAGATDAAAAETDGVMAVGTDVRVGVTTEVVGRG
jgi:hypothetical protein